MKKIYTSIDIGSDTIKIVTGEKHNNNVIVLASASVKSKGIKKGLIIEPNLTINAIKDGIKNINAYLGIEIKKVIVNVPNYNSNFMFVSGKLDITNEDDIVTSEDISKIIKNSIYCKLALDYELVTVIPVTYILDGHEVKKPLGLKGKELEMKGIMISVPKKNIYSVLSVVEEGAGLEVVDITFSGIGDYFEVKDDNLDKKIGAIINLGHETANVSIINKGIFMNTETIQLGGLNIENDLAYVFHINIFDARIIKEKFACSHKRFASVTDSYEIKNNLGESLKLNQIEVSEVVMSRLGQILELTKKQILLLTKKNINYVIITGGLTEIKGFRNLVVDIFGKNVIIYTTSTIGVRNNKYTTALGMIKYFINKMEIRGKEYTMINEFDEEKIINPRNNKNKAKITRIFGSFISNNKEEK